MILSITESDNVNDRNSIEKHNVNLQISFFWVLSLYCKLVNGQSALYSV